MHHVPTCDINTRNTSAGVYKHTCVYVTCRYMVHLEAIHFPIELLLNHHLNYFQASDQVKICVIMGLFSSIIIIIIAVLLFI